MTQDYQIISALLNQDPESWKKHHINRSSKSKLLTAYRNMVEMKEIVPNKRLEQFLQMKPVRTQSGVTPVTVLTKPFPCPGECIFCPTDVRMPKSYIASEPGAQRAAQHAFDPYAQVMSRLTTYHEIGHDIGKVELIVLGGTWSVYPEPYQIWFIKRLFQALNEFGQGAGYKVEGIVNTDDHLKDGETYNQHIAKTQYIRQKTDESATWEELWIEHKKNETSQNRCVGLVLETRPDYATEAEVVRLRKLGATKIQIGIQSLNDHVLTLNKRGHTVPQTITALKLLRQAGFKIHGHMMPNLYGNTPVSDKLEYAELFNNPSFRPDELKIYPCSLIPDTELVQKYESGEWQPYTHEELADVLRYCLMNTPEYCRLTRIVRDIPSHEIMVGNKHTNFRQMVESHLDKTCLHDIRSREIRNRTVSFEDVSLEDVTYTTLVSEEHFLQFVTSERKIAAFLRLSIPLTDNFINELHESAIIREVHVYGQAIAAGKVDDMAAQHQGFGKQLIQKAQEICASKGFVRLAVISAVGTREYYRKQGFVDGTMYQYLSIGIYENN